MDDSALDHIEQYWTGGKTIPENARLTHRYCNNARSRNETPQIIGKTPLTPIITRTRRRTSRTISIENERIFCNNSISILVNTANWLIKKGKIKKSDCPIKLDNIGFRYLIHTEPKHNDGSSFQRKINLVSNFYLEGKRSANDILKNTKDLLTYYGINKYDLDE